MQHASHSNCSTILQGHPNLPPAVQRGQHRGPVELRREDHAHQLPGVPSSPPGVLFFAKNKNPDYPSLDGQYVSADIHQQTRGTISSRLNSLAKDLWLWYMERSILLKAQHLAGVLSTIAGDKSRVMKDQSDWKLSSSVPSDEPEAWTTGGGSTCQQTDSPAAGWRTDLKAMAMDAFTLHCAELRAYANPPWNPIGRVLADSPTASRACPGGTGVDGTGMVPSATGDAGES